MAIKKDKREGQGYKSLIFGGMGLVAVVCFMLLFAGMGVVSATDYYVSLSGKNSDGGTTLDTAWRTITFAATKAQAGDTVHIKGGNYGREHVVIKNTGTAANPIVFKGFDGTPVVTGQGETGTGIYIHGKDYITVRNIKITKYRWGIELNGADYITMDNLEVSTCEDIGILLWESDHCILKNSDVIDTDSLSIWIKCSNYNLIESCTSSSETPSQATGYYITISYSHDNTVRNCSAHNEHGGILSHHGHGIGIKDNPEESFTHSYNNKIIDCETHAIGEAFFVAHHAHDNEFINCKAYRDDLTATDWVQGFSIRDGAHNNIFKNCRVDGYRWGFSFAESGECSYSAVPKDNIIENSIIHDSRGAIRFQSGLGGNNQILNCVVDDASELIDYGNAIGNSVKNCVITDVTSFGDSTPTITYSDFWSNGFNTPSGTGNMNANPLFVDSANSNYHLQSDSPCRGAGAGGVDMGAYPEGESRDVGAISGTVTNGTNPIQGATVTVNSYSDETDSNGYYEISNVPVGLYTVTASASGYYQKSQEDVQVSKDQTTTVNFQFPVAETPEAPGAPGFVGNWQFEEGPFGTIAFDSSGHGNDGAIVNAFFSNRRKIGDYALGFDGEGDYVEISHSTSLDITDAITIVLWIKPGSVDGERSILGKREAYVLKTSGDEIRFTTPGKKDHISNGAGLVSGSWQHVAVVFVADDVARFYKNGSFISSDSASTMSSSTYPLLIGTNQWNERFRGIIDKVKIYSRALSTEEIRTDYENGTANG